MSHQTFYSFVAAIETEAGTVRSSRGRALGVRAHTFAADAFCLDRMCPQPIVIKELLQTATAGAVLAIATTAQGGLLVGGYAKGPSLMFDFVAEPMVATVETAFLGLLYMLGGVDDDQCTSFRSRAQPSGAHQGGPLTPKGDAFAPQTCRRSRHPWKHVGQRHLPQLVTSGQTKRTTM